MGDENILAKVSGEYVAAALKTLPDPEMTKDEIQETVIEVPKFGMVRFTCQRKIARQGKNRRSFWAAIKAVRVG